MLKAWNGGKPTAEFNNAGQVRRLPAALRAHGVGCTARCAAPGRACMHEGFKSMAAAAASLLAGRAFLVPEGREGRN